MKMSFNNNNNYNNDSLYGGGHNNNGGRGGNRNYSYNYAEGGGRQGGGRRGGNDRYNNNNNNKNYYGHREEGGREGGGGGGERGRHWEQNNHYRGGGQGYHDNGRGNSNPSSFLPRQQQQQQQQPSYQQPPVQSFVARGRNKMEETPFSVADPVQKRENIPTLAAPPEPKQYVKMEGTSPPPVPRAAIKMEDTTTMSPMKEEEIMKDISSNNNNNNNNIEATMTKEEVMEEYHRLVRIPNVTERLNQFQKLSRNDKINMLLPDIITVDENLPPLEFKEDWDETVRTATEEVIGDIRIAIQNEKRQKMDDCERYYNDEEDDDDDDDSDDGYGDPWRDLPSSSSNNNNRMIQEYESDYERYVKMLPYCFPMVLGFQAIPVSDLGDTQWCYCPGSKHMSKWRELCAIGDELGVCTRTNTKSKKMGPKELIAHIRDYAGTNHNCKFHKYTIDYLVALYRNLNGEGIGHIAFENPNTSKYKTIHRVMMQRIVETIELYRREAMEKKRMEEELAKIQEEKTQLEKTNIDLSKQIQAKEEMKKKFGVKTEKAKELDQAQLDFYKNGCDMLLESQRKPHEQLWREQKKNKKNDTISIEAPQPFRLQDLFDKWYKKDDTFLLSSLDKSNRKPQFYASNFFQRWEVNFKAENVDGKKIKFQNQTEMLAVDDGGPKRQFAGELMKQMVDLVVIDEGKTYKLFEVDGAGCNPAKDDQLKDCRCLDKVKKMYTALGRFFALCILNQETKNDDDNDDEDKPTELISLPIPIAPNCFPRLFRNLLFREVDPLNKNYETGDLIDDAFALLNKEDLNRDDLFEFACIWFDVEDEDVQGDDVDDRLRHQLKKHLVDSRSIALGALKEGISLGGSFPIRIFQLIPLEAMSKMFFARQDLTSKEFLDEDGAWRSWVKVVHDGYDDDDETKLIEHAENQNLLNEAFRELVQKSDSEFLRELLCFCTAYSYLPDLSVHTDFELKIEFNLNECDEEALPVAHTCVNTIKFPSHAYGGDKEKFKEKLVESLTYSRSSFNMQ